MDKNGLISYFVWIILPVYTITLVYSLIYANNPIMFLIIIGNNVAWTMTFVYFKNDILSKKRKSKHKACLL